MKILFVDLGRAGKLFSTGRMFEEKLHESSLNDVEVTTADVAEDDWKLTGRNWHCGAQM